MRRGYEMFIVCSYVGAMTLATEMNTTRFPKVAEELGLLDRYRYFDGKSGKRYIFTRMTASDLADCAGAVVIIPPSARQAETQLPVIGEVDRDGKFHGLGAARTRRRAGEVFVHLLAGSAKDRKTVLDDLKASFGLS
ncbi:hypothetical protein SAMN05444272_3538 [Roseibium suaedae]|uniref:Uncharacterized protein n=2 Tax=Roseibium suaedae TaxID=735517 RepID=A0A1M7MSV3_9HYPH|nr:hypothetical protein SAMN05444272_3538 [Roseibium suaedae]